MNVNDKLKIIKLHINIINILLKVLNEFKAILLIKDKYMVIFLKLLYNLLISIVERKILWKKAKVKQVRLLKYLF